MLVQSSASLTIAETSPPAAINPHYTPSDSIMTVTALPPTGTVLLADGLTPVRLGQTLTLAQLGALRFRPAQSGTAGRPGFGSPTGNPVGAVAGAEAGLPAGHAVFSVPQNSGARTIGVQISFDPDLRASGSYAIITALPANGAVLLADGTIAVTQGQTLTAAQFKRLRFRPAADASGQISTLSYLIIGPAGGAVAGCVLLIVGPAPPPLSATGRSGHAPASLAGNIRPGDERASFSAGNGQWPANVSSNFR